MQRGSALLNPALAVCLLPPGPQPSALHLCDPTALPCLGHRNGFVEYFRQATPVKWVPVFLSWACGNVLSM